jgi:hypothetical protein
MKPNSSLIAMALVLFLDLSVARALSACASDGNAAVPRASPPDAAFAIPNDDPPIDDDEGPRPSPADPSLDGGGGDIDVTSPRTLGETYVRERRCATCHQPDDPNLGTLSGQTTARFGTAAYGANLTPDRQTGLGTWSDEEILRAIREGLDDTGAPLCAPMPRFDDIGEDEGTAIVAYLRSLPAVKRKIPDSQCATANDTDDGGDADAADAGDAGDAAPCTMLPPQATAHCDGCGDARGGCQHNGCLFGDWCAPETSRCHPRPAACK